MSIPLADSPIESITFRNQHFYLKRDDLLHPSFAGNKARKLYYLLDNEFEGVNRLIAYGSPQANSLYSLSAAAQLKGWKFDFYVDHIAQTVIDNPQGNYRGALENGANVIAVSDLLNDRDMKTYIEQDILPKYSDALFVPEGGRFELAALGVEMLADEIMAWANEVGIDNLEVALPSGTGTTALFMQRRFLQKTNLENNSNFKVLTCACVGGDEYLKKQFFELSPDEAFHPTILKSDRKYHFGKLYDEFYSLWQELKQETEIEFELLYDPLGWKTLLDYKVQTMIENNQNQAPILYIHQGGLLGNETMLPRYERKLRLKA